MQMIGQSGTFPLRRQNIQYGDFVDYCSDNMTYNIESNALNQSVKVRYIYEGCIPPLHLCALVTCKKRTKAQLLQRMQSLLVLTILSGYVFREKDLYTTIY